jgi:DNA-binding NarL/FixJ family response regulator
MTDRSGEAESGAAAVPESRLSDRELEVFELIGKGKTTRDIATTLNLSVKTVETHRVNIKRKLGLDTNTSLIRQAVQWTLRGD